MGDSRLSALDLKLFFRSSAVPCPKTTLDTHSDKQFLGYEILPRIKVRTPMPEFSLQKQCRGIHAGRETILGNRGQNFNSNQQVKVLNHRLTYKTLQSLIYFIKTMTAEDIPYRSNELPFGFKGRPVRQGKAPEEQKGNQSIRIVTLKNIQG
jgi:hypothetical protein